MRSGAPGQWVALDEWVTDSFKVFRIGGPHNEYLSGNAALPSKTRHEQRQKRVSSLAGCDLIDIRAAQGHRGRGIWRSWQGNP